MAILNHKESHGPNDICKCEETLENMTSRLIGEVHTSDVLLCDALLFLRQIKAKVRTTDTVENLTAKIKIHLDRK